MRDALKDRYPLFNPIRNRNAVCIGESKHLAFGKPNPLIPGSIATWTAFVCINGMGKQPNDFPNPWIFRPVIIYNDDFVRSFRVRLIFQSLQTLFEEFRVIEHRNDH